MSPATPAKILFLFRPATLARRPDVFRDRPRRGFAVQVDWNVHTARMPREPDTWRGALLRTAVLPDVVDGHMRLFSMAWT